MPVSYYNTSETGIYSLNAIHHEYKLPPLQASVNKKLFEKHHQFSDTSCQEKSIMIDKLIDASADIIDSIWCNNIKRKTKVMSTSRFIREILKRSRATYSMLQLALFYIFRIKNTIQEQIQYQQSQLNHNELVCCGRRMFLAALMVSSKYLNDKNYRNKTWAKIASLGIAEINATELVFLKLIDYQLYVGKSLYDKWVSLLHGHIKNKQLIHHTLQQQQQLQQHKKGQLYHYNTHYRYSTADTTKETSSLIPLSDVIDTPPLVYGTKRSSSFSTFDDTVTHKRVKHV